MIQATINRLEELIQVIPNKIYSISSLEFEEKNKPEKWSKKEILGHLIDSALYNLQRFNEIQFSPSPYIVQTYAQDDLVKTNAYQKVSREDLLSCWKSLNKQILFCIKNIPKEKFNNIIVSPGGVNQNLQWLIKDYLSHLEYHLNQIIDSLDFSEKNNLGTISVQEAVQQLAKENAKPFTTLMQHGSMLVELYVPEKVDLQTPHLQDELYVVISGHGTFINNGQKQNFVAGDVLFVKAGVEHRFENFTDDFKTWVIFYGPNGGEKENLFFETSKIIQERKYTISTDPSKVDVDIVINFLIQSYWAKKRPVNVIKKSLKHSMNFGLYLNKKQIGFARLITDRATYAYLADVFVIDKYKGMGLGKWLIKTVTYFEEFRNLKNWFLLTEDAHGLYKQYGFKMSDRHEKLMERKFFGEK